MEKTDIRVYRCRVSLRRATKSWLWLEMAWLNRNVLARVIVDEKRRGEDSGSCAVSLI